MLNSFSFNVTNITALVSGFVAVVVVILLWVNFQAQSTQQEVNKQLKSDINTEMTEDMIVAGGCFWCVEADMEKAPGVVSVISGYSGGSGDNPTYENYYKTGHREVVKVTYDPEQITYRQLLYYFIKHIDPTDGEGSFVDRGEQYAPAIYYETQRQKETAQAVLKDITNRDVFKEPLQVPVKERKKFWRAEDYHQDYYRVNPVRYKTYRAYSGRDGFIEKHWGDKADKIPERAESASGTSYSASSSKTQGGGSDQSSWKNYQKPSQSKLRDMLGPVEYEVTQEDGTESAYDNELWDEEREGIYVDVLSGEPLFSSKNKYKSGTGWPSFTKPLEPANITTEADYLLGYRRTEVRSKYGDNHLGHVFSDGPNTLEASGGAKPTGLRYCLNSAALRFIPKENMQEEGYGEYLSIFNQENN